MSVIQALAKSTKIDLLRLMMLSREGDRREGILLRQSKGWFQVSGMGHEALAAFAFQLNQDDYLFPYYRDRALMLARGLTNYDLALAYFAKRTSSSGGRQMPGHYSSRKHNIFSVCTPTGGALLPACGTAWGMKLEQKPNVCLATIGDAATRQGEFFEAVAFAAQENLPVIFLVEDNKYGISTPTEKFLPFHLNIFDKNAVVELDGRNVDAIHEVAAKSIEKARTGNGPTLIWCDLDRLSSHTSSDDHRVYRSPNEIEAMLNRDPIKLLSDQLISSGDLTETQFKALQEEIVAQVDADYLAAEKEIDPSSSEVMLYAEGNEPQAEKPPIKPEKQTMVSAINTVFHKALDQDPKVIFFGEDIEDPKGGVFGLTKGLSEKFPHQVFNSPLAEATIMGTAVGLAASGFKPVFELQFIDFVAPGWNQITTNMSSLTWRSFGEWKCPCVIYTPYGAYLPGGSLWHSQSNESALIHLPGLKVAIPSTPEDAAGLFWTALKSDGPVFILIPKHIFRKSVQVESVESVPFGKARIVQEGTQITLVTYGNGVELATDAVKKSSASVEIIDLRSLAPYDINAIKKSLEKTGRLLLLQEDIERGGFGQTVISDVTTRPDLFNLLYSPPKLVARQNVHIGFNPIYEYAALPSEEEVVSAIEQLLE